MIKVKDKEYQMTEIDYDKTLKYGVKFEMIASGISENETSRILILI